MSGPVLRLPDDPVEYAGWGVWRARKARPSSVEVQTIRHSCASCWGQGAAYEPVYRRSAERMADEDRRRPHYLLVLCSPCGGRGIIERIVAVVVGQ